MKNGSSNGPIGPAGFPGPTIFADNGAESRSTMIRSLEANGLHCRLTLVSTPAGSGRTTAVALVR